MVEATCFHGKSFRKHSAGKCHDIGILWLFFLAYIKAECKYVEIVFLPLANATDPWGLSHCALCLCGLLSYCLQLQTHPSLFCFVRVGLGLYNPHFLLFLLAPANSVRQWERGAGRGERDLPLSAVASSFLSLSHSVTHCVPSAEFCPCTKMNVLTRKQLPDRMRRNEED